jgi:hypothetical protein
MEDRMLKLPMKIALIAAGPALLAATAAALAAHEKAGLWEITITLSGNNMHMPDLSKLPPDVQARVRAAGVGMGGNTITARRCLSAQDIVAHKLPSLGSHGKDCSVANVTETGSHMSADMTCSAHFVGSGHVQADWDSDEHYTAEVDITGSANGQNVTSSEKIEGRFLSAECGGAGQ